MSAIVVKGERLLDLKSIFSFDSARLTDSMQNVSEVGLVITDDNV